MKDPRCRKDGLCACGCGKKRTLKVSKNSALRGADRKALEQHLTADPFATTTCCRKWHGCPLEETGLTRGQANRLEEEAA